MTIESQKAEMEKPTASSCCPPPRLHAHPCMGTQSELADQVSPTALTVPPSSLSCILLGSLPESDLVPALPSSARSSFLCFHCFLPACAPGQGPAEPCPELSPCRLLKEEEMVVVMVQGGAPGHRKDAVQCKRGSSEVWQKEQRE